MLRSAEQGVIEFVNARTIGDSHDQVHDGKGLLNEGAVGRLEAVEDSVLTFDR